jgi:hypothetical protein
VVVVASLLLIFALLSYCCNTYCTAALQLENSRLRQEIDRLKARLPALGLSSGFMQQQQLRRTGSDVGQPGVDVLREQLAQVRHLLSNAMPSGSITELACVLEVLCEQQASAPVEGRRSDVGHPNGAPANGRARPLHTSNA